MLIDNEPNLVHASRCGLSMMRALHTSGYHVDSQRGTVELPIDEMRSALEKPTAFPCVTVPLGHRTTASPQVPIRS